uniref:Peptidase S1 domain-containing protein n=1 Tax=Erpetoichthys calabaricus TaxID=27687 RepID=A0A8C4S4G7_ERPCA
MHRRYLTILNRDRLQRNTFQSQYSLINKNSLHLVCGRPISPPFQFQRIFGGRLAARGNFPWQVYFHSPRGGAANMLREDHFELFAGIVDISEEGLANAVKLQIADKFIHPNYTYAEKGEIQYNYNNDIALLKLTEKVKVGQFLSPICLLQDASDTELENGKLGYISGWGLTEKRKLSNDLRYAEWVKKENFVFTPNMFCAGAYGLDNCHGDGGGAFAILNDQDRFFVEGIVSWGFKCGTYSVYTKVVNYLEWITKTMGVHECIMKWRSMQGWILPFEYCCGKRHTFQTRR